MSTHERRPTQTAIALLIALVFLLIMFGSLAIGGSAFPGIIFLFFLIVVVIAITNRAMHSGPRIQRPYTEHTAFPPPPPPDTILVKCDYCMTSQTFKEKCENCGAPLPKPGFR